MAVAAACYEPIGFRVAVAAACYEPIGVYDSRPEFRAEDFGSGIALSSYSDIGILSIYWVLPMIGQNLNLSENSNFQ